jgi:hypothetical protein
MSDFRREVAENCALLGYYSASSGNFLPTFWDRVQVPYSRFLNSEYGMYRFGSIGCPEMSVSIYYYSLSNNPEEHSSL